MIAERRKRSGRLEESWKNRTDLSFVLSRSRPAIVESQTHPPPSSLSFLSSISFVAVVLTSFANFDVCDKTLKSVREEPFSFHTFSSLLHSLHLDLVSISMALIVTESHQSQVFVTNPKTTLLGHASTVTRSFSFCLLSVNSSICLSISFYLFSFCSHFLSRIVSEAASEQF